MVWQLDSTHSQVGFAVRHMMISTVRGRFQKYSGSIDIDEQDLSRSSAAGEIEVASIDTGAAQRDEHLRSADFFDVADHPAIVYKTKIIPAALDANGPAGNDL